MPYKMKGFPMIEGTEPMKKMKEGAMKKMHASPTKAMSPMKDDEKSSSEAGAAFGENFSKSIPRLAGKLTKIEKKVATGSKPQTTMTTEELAEHKGIKNPQSTLKKMDDSAKKKMHDGAMKKMHDSAMKKMHDSAMKAMKDPMKKMEGAMKAMDGAMKAMSPKKMAHSPKKMAHSPKNMGHSPTKAMSPKKKTIAKQKGFDEKTKTKTNNKKQKKITNIQEEPLFMGGDITATEFKNMSVNELKKLNPDLTIQRIRQIKQNIK